MLVLFVNCHKQNEEGRSRFQQFYNSVHSLFRKTVYFGNQVTQTVRNYDQLHDYIYDEISFRTQQRCQRRFQSLAYLVVDGGCGFAPWTDCMADAVLLIRKAIEQEKKILCHGFGHFAAHYYLTTCFDKHVKITKQHSGKKCDFQWDQITGDLSLKGHKTGNSGVKIISSNRPFNDKSSHALAKGLTLASKFDYVIFDSKGGTKLLKNIETPFGFYWKSKLFCTSKTVSQMKGDVLLQTQHGAPIAFSYNNLLSVQGSCPQVLKLINNWLAAQTNRFIDFDEPPGSQKIYQTIAFENKMEYRKALSSSASQLRLGSRMSLTRPQTSKFSTLDYQKPFVRCSGKYETINERYLKQQLSKKSLNKGRSRMAFQGKLTENQIANYVYREPSRPPSSHKFRQVHKDKWVGGRDFINL